MLIFASDLHLADDPVRGRFESRSFGAAVEARVATAASDDPVTLVLLGDIFELLKSEVWTTCAVRPWSEPGDALSSAARKILDRIIANNGEFFEILRRLNSERGVSIAYIPGNHDGLLGDSAVSGVRERIRQAIPALPGMGDANFDPVLIDFDHGVVADHGHTMDPNNRPLRDGSRFVVGDAIVIELLVRLPGLVAQALGDRVAAAKHRQPDPRIAFLHDIDNIVPLDPATIVHWLESVLGKLPRHERREIEACVVAAMARCIGHLSALMKHHKAPAFARWTTRALRYRRFLKTLARIRSLFAFLREKLDSGNAVVEHLGSICAPSSDRAQSIDLYVAGHTHNALHREFDLRQRKITYVNTGTWRNVKTRSWSFSGSTFHDYFHGTLLCVRRLADRQQGRYEFLHHVRGN